MNFPPIEKPLPKLIINAAITGIVPTRAQSPHVPITADEIVADAARCRDAGASVIHLHVRDADGQPTYEGERFAEVIGRIRADSPDLILSGSTSGRIHREFGQRAAVLTLPPDLRPDLGSLTLGSLNFPGQASVNEPAMIRALAETMHERGIVPEWELFDLGMADYARYLIDRKVLVGPHYANILLGSLGTLAATPENLCAMVRALPEGTTWSATGIGRFQFAINALAVTMGGHVRVGLEDNLFYDAARTRLATNAGLIERVVRLARAAEREIATPDEARRMIGLPARVPLGRGDEATSGPGSS